MADKARLAEADKRLIWHPFTQMKDWEKETPVIIEEGSGAWIRDADGKWYIDGVSSLWVNIHGHRKKELDDALKNQLDKIAHSTLLGLSNVPAIELAEALSELLEASFPSGPSRIFYSDNGSTAVEVGLKMAFQYWRHKGDKRKTSFMSLRNAYHGDTLGAVSVGGIDIFHEAFGPLLFRTHKAPSPFCYRCELGLEPETCSLGCARKAEEILAEHHEEIAGFIIEPLVQAAGGMLMSPPGYLRAVRDLCKKYDVLFIADEVATGFGRTGKMFACEHEGVSPDIICLSKGITGGYLPLAVTAATEEIYSAFLGEFSELKTFFHGHSYTGNQLGCATAAACLEIFRREKTIVNMQPKIEYLRSKLAEMSALPHVGNVRAYGLMAGIEIVRDKTSKEPYAWEERAGWKVALRARGLGVFIRPLGNVLVVMPPLCIEMEDLKKMMDVLEKSILETT